jgi:hypothetical protein
LVRRRKETKKLDYPNKDHQSPAAIMNIILNVCDTIVLCGSMFEYCPMKFFLNIFDCYCFKFGCGFLQNVPEIMSNTTGVTCGAGTAYPAEVLEFTTGFNVVPDVL